MGCTCGSDLGNAGSAILPQRELTIMESKYCLSLLATCCASLLRVIGSRFLPQYFVEIFHHSQYVTT